MAMKTTEKEKENSAGNTERRRHAAAEWAAVSGGGACRVEEIGKKKLMRRTGLPARDLRALDPAQPFAASVVGRDRAVLVCLEGVRAVITASEVLVPSPRDPAVAALVRDIRARLGSEALVGDGEDGRALGMGSDRVLPFEFKVLEVCLESTCKLIEDESSTLEKEAYPALDELSSKISTLNLERVRQIKSRLVATSGRVQKVREELEHLLDDDVDMAAMHLTEKLAYRVGGRSSRLFDIDKEASESDDKRDDDEIEAVKGGSDSVAAIGLPLRTNELESLLEAYFVRIEGALNKLSTLREYVDDTEDYINIMLDDKQNQLLEMGVMLSTATLVITGGILVTGVLAMNIHIPLFKFPPLVFWQATVGIVGGSIALYILAIFYYKSKGILR